MATGAAQSKILIVDDEPMVRRSILRKLTAEGYSCTEAGSGDQAVEILPNDTFDLIIMDVKMPGRSGNEVLPEIRRGYPDIAIIMSTAVTDSNIIIECMREGAQDYIIKPFDPNQLSTCVARTLHTRQLELELKEYKVHLELKVQEQTKQIRTMFLSAINSLVFALEAKDKYTAGHSMRVTAVSMLIAFRLRLEQDLMENLRWGALLHDVGKIAVDPTIQNKPSALTPEEYQHIMTHVYVGPSIVEPIVNKEIIAIIRHHHDRYEGGGILQGALEGENIPFGARIVAVADTFDAITSDRPYRAGRSMEEAIAEIRRSSGTQLDPRIADTFADTPPEIIAGAIRNPAGASDSAGSANSWLFSDMYDASQGLPIARQVHDGIAADAGNDIRVGSAGK
jgi:putative two-component system response regulator